MLGDGAQDANDGEAAEEPEDASERAKKVLEGFVEVATRKRDPKAFIVYCLEGSDVNIVGKIQRLQRWDNKWTMSVQRFNFVEHANQSKRHFGPVWEKTGKTSTIKVSTSSPGDGWIPQEDWILPHEVHSDAFCMGKKTRGRTAFKYELPLNIAEATKFYEARGGGGTWQGWR